MENQEVKKLISFVKDMPENYNLLKKMLLDYLHLREENKNLVRRNIALLEDAKQYERLVEEKLSEDFIVH